MLLKMDIALILAVSHIRSPRSVSKTRASALTTKGNMQTYYLLLAAYWIEKFDKQVIALVADTSKPNHLLNAGQTFGLIPKQHLSEQASREFFFHFDHFEREMLSPINQNLVSAQLQRNKQNEAAQQTIIDHYRKLDIFIAFEEPCVEETHSEVENHEEIPYFKLIVHGPRIRVGRMHCDPYL